MSAQQAGAGDAGRPRRNLQDLGVRLLSALVMAGAALGTLRIGGHVFVIFWLLAAAAVLYEWQAMIGGGGLFRRFGIGALSLAAASAFASNAGPDYAIGILAGGAGLVALASDKGKRVWAAAGVFYAGVIVVALGTLRFTLAFPFAELSIAWIFALVWGTDVMAYFGGRLIGGPKLWPRVSPSKTWSGTLTGVFCGAALGWAVTLLSSVPVSDTYVVLLGLALACLSQAGDLMESSMKRHFGVKDSSHFIPGHGGFMDRLDGFVFASAFAALIGTLRLDALQAPAGLFQW